MRKGLRRIEAHPAFIEAARIDRPLAATASFNRIRHASDMVTLSCMPTKSARKR